MMSHQVSESTDRINCYTCRDGHKTITIDVDHGTTPMFLNCRHTNCNLQATSSFYRVEPGLVPEYEWYKPDLKDVKAYEMDHVLSGGLLIRPVTGNKSTAIAPSMQQMKAIQAFTNNFRSKNPKASDRQFKRALLKKFGTHFE